MSIVNSLLKVFLGDKSGKDLKKLTPIVDEINNHFNKLSSPEQGAALQIIRVPSR